MRILQQQKVLSYTKSSTDSQNDPSSLLQVAAQPESGAEAAEEQDRVGLRVNRDNKSPLLMRPNSSPKCYACIDCPQVFTNTPQKYCPYTPDPSKQNRCVVYAEKYKRKYTWDRLNIKQCLKSF